MDCLWVDQFFEIYVFTEMILYICLDYQMYSDGAFAKFCFQFLKYLPKMCIYVAIIAVAKYLGKFCKFWKGSNTQCICSEVNWSEKKNKKNV